MKNLLVARMSAVGAAFAAMFTAADSYADCSLKTLHGSYGYYRQGAYSGGPLVSLGFAVYDGSGNLTYSQTTIKNGIQGTDIFDPPDTITYTVNPNCTGTFVDTDGTTIAEIVVVDGGKEIDFVSLTGNSVIGVAKRIPGDE